MIKAKIKSMIDQTLVTGMESKLLVAGEVTTIQFANQREIDSYVKIGSISIVNQSVNESKNIPVIGIING